MEAVESVAGELVSTISKGETRFINLPLIYPGGGSVTVKVDPMAGGYRVSDNGFAYREIECLGGQRSFGRIVSQIVEAEGLQRSARTLFLDVSRDQLFRAICDIGAASWRVADRIVSSMEDEDETEVDEVVRERIVEIFGKPHVELDGKVVGSSSSEWDVTAIVRSAGVPTIFQAVGMHANAIYRASTEFHDLAALDRPLNLVAVVRDKSALGRRFGLLSKVGRVIQEDQSDDVYRKAAA
jgi:hypothetical protein